MKRTFWSPAGRVISGSHICVELLGQGYDVTVMDNLANSNEKAPGVWKRSQGRSSGSMRPTSGTAARMMKFFRRMKFTGHPYGGLKAVGESVRKPLAYFDNNVSGTIVLLEKMKEHHIKRIIFSSSATVYDLTQGECLTEKSPIGNSTSPYGRTKLVIEQMLADLYHSDARWSYRHAALFQSDRRTCKRPDRGRSNGEPNNLMPYITQVAVGKREKLNIFGNDYDTPDGTCIRDYIHVMDLAGGHSKAVRKLEEQGLFIYNLGTGQPQSVLCGRPCVRESKRP